MSTDQDIRMNDFKASAPSLEPSDFDGKQVDPGVGVHFDGVVENQNLLILSKGESLVDGLRRLQSLDQRPDAVPLVSTFKGNCGCFTLHTVLEGQLGCCTLYGRTHFLPPGNYFRVGVGTKVHKIVTQEDAHRSGTQFTWKDLTYLSLSENQAAVIQEADRQLIIGSGRYILRHPTTLYGVVDVHSLARIEKCEAITEEAGPMITRPTGQREAQDIQVTKMLTAGSHQKVGAVTFIRAAPGFCYVVQDSAGSLRSGVGFNICRGGELLIGFTDRQNYARTTRTFHLESKDRQEVQTRVQLRWRLTDACLWVQRKGASTDIFDAIEEISQAMLRDAIAAHTYQECTEQAGEGYEGIENRVRGPLSEETHLLGGLLLGFEIRELRFPLLERRNAARAEQEARQAEQLLEMKKQAHLDEQNRSNTDARLDHQRAEEQRKLAHDTKLQVLQHEKDRVEAEARQKLDLIDLENKSKANKIRMETMEAESMSDANRKLVAAKAKAQEGLAQAQAEAQSKLALADAEANSRIKLAEADAKAAELVGAAYRANQDYLHLEMARLNAEVLKIRAESMATAMTNNPAAMMSSEMQRELSILTHGFSPIPNVVVQGSGGFLGEQKIAK